MLKKIMVGVDVADGRSALLKCLGGLRELDAKEAVVAFCVDVPNVPGVLKSLQGLLGPELETMCRVVRQTGIEAHPELLVGPASSALAEAADRRGCSLIVVASRVRTLVGDALLGSVAHAAMCHARLPVLVLRLSDAGQEVVCRHWPCGRVEHILFPTDFSGPAEQALQTVRRLAERTKARVTVLHVQDRGKWGQHLEARLEEFNRIDGDRMERIADDLRKAGAADVALDLRVGHPGREVVDASKAPGFSVIVMASQGRGFLGEMAIGSVSHYVARRAAVPVWLVPAAGALTPTEGAYEKEG